MKPGLISTAILAAAVSLTTTGKLSADAGDALVGGIIGGVIGGAIVNESNKRKTTKVYRAPTYSADRVQNREVQTSLNYFGFAAGTPDGVMGSRSRAAVSQYQAHLGYPVTGYLTQYERDFLLGSYHRAIAGGSVTHQQVAANPMGTRGLLLQYRDQAAGVAVPTTPPAHSFVATARVPTPAPAQVVPQATEVAAAPTVQEPAPSALALPNFLGGGEGLSLASHCNTVSLLTNTNGGFTTINAMSDPNVVLNEQFCLARTYAIATGEELAAGVQAVGTSQITAQCQSFGPVMKDYVASLSLKPSAAVLQDVSGFVLTTGMAPQQLAATSKICLSVGYRTDDMDVAIGSGLILVALGERVYGELMGHHLSQGFGATRRDDLAAGWYDMALSALEAGQPAVFAPGQPERVALIRAAVTPGGGQAGTMTAPVQPASALPNFSLNK